MKISMQLQWNQCDGHSNKRATINIQRLNCYLIFMEISSFDTTPPAVGINYPHRKCSAQHSRYGYYLFVRLAADSALIKMCSFKIFINAFAILWSVRSAIILGGIMLMFCRLSPSLLLHCGRHFISLAGHLISQWNWFCSMMEHCVCYWGILPLVWIYIFMLRIINVWLIFINMLASCDNAFNRN